MYFYDTYILIELVKGRLREYKPKEFITTELNLMELYYILLKVYNKKTAIHFYNLYKVFTIPINDEIIQNAMDFRFSNKKLKLSYVDCLGYITSFQKEIKFVTGDDQFQNLPNLEFVK